MGLHRHDNYARRSMTPYLPVFFYQLLAFLAAFLVFGRQRELSWTTQLITLSIFLTCPFWVAIKGAQSAVYINDLLCPLLMLGALLSRRVRRGVRDPIWIAFATFLVFLPIIAGTISALLAGGGGDIGARDVNGTLIWFYRNTFYLMLLLHGQSTNMGIEQLRAFIRLFVVLTAVLVGFGIVNYAAGVNLAIFDQLLMFRDYQGLSYIAAKRAGWGFLGLFRASVGQWFATTAILLFGAMLFSRVKWSLVMVVLAVSSIGLILFSFSRAGLVGLAAGLGTLAFLGRGIVQRVLAVIGLLCAFGWVIWQQDTVGSRVESIATVKDVASAGRIAGWHRGMSYLLNNPDKLLFGIGPTNQEGVFHVVGSFGAHNEYLDTVFRMGIGGLVCELAILFYLVRRLMRTSNLNDPGLNAFMSTMLACLVGNMVMGITQEHLVRTYSGFTCGALLYWLYGILLGVNRPARSQTGRTSKILSWAGERKF